MGDSGGMKFTLIFVELPNPSGLEGVEMRLQLFIHKTFPFLPLKTAKGG